MFSEFKIELQIQSIIHFLYDKKNLQNLTILFTKRVGLFRKYGLAFDSDYIEYVEVEKL